MAAVIWKLLVKGWPGAARSFVLALALLLCATTLGEAAEPADATIVLQLQLPPSTSPETVRGLIADLAAKGAYPVTQPTATAEAGARPMFNVANIAAQAFKGSKQALQALPFLRRMPQIWIEQVEADGGTPEVALWFWIVALAGLAAAPLIGVAFRTLVDRQQTRVSEVRPTPRFWVAVIRFLAELASLALFGVFLWAALLWISRGVPILGESADQLLWFALKWRLLITVLMIVVSPKRADLRLLAFDDTDARISFWWLAVYFAVIPLSPFLIWLVERLGFVHDTVLGAALALGLSITTYKVAMYWAIRRPIARAILAATGDEPGPVRRAVAASWHWFFITLTLVVFLMASVEFSLGKGAAAVFSSASATTGIIVALAVLGQASHNLIARLFLAEAGDVRLASRRGRLRRALHRLSEAFLWILGGAWLAETWGLDLVNPPPGSLAQLFVRPIFEAAATIVAAWILWIGIIGALERLGFNIGPLLAGLGVIGIAIGFGAQNLVRDVISGVFFLMEDA